MYGHIEIMARAVAEGVRSANADVVFPGRPRDGAGTAPARAANTKLKCPQPAPLS